jgi:SAM-dependent methyltransferase
MIRAARRTLAILNRNLFRPARLREDSTEPVGRLFGRERGTPIDRYYIEAFLERNRASVRGRVLEVGDDTYTRRFGEDRVTEAAVLHVAEWAGASLVGDLSKPESLPADRFDCFICTQTFNFIFDVQAAIRGAHRLLAPGGVLLATMAGIAQISTGDADRWGDYWRFTVQSATRAFGDVFGPASVSVDFAGNVYSATSFLRGIALEEVSSARLDVKDPEYPMTILVIARKD